MLLLQGGLKGDELERRVPSVPFVTSQRADLPNVAFQCTFSDTRSDFSFVGRPFFHRDQVARELLVGKHQIAEHFADVDAV